MISISLFQLIVNLMFWTGVIISLTGLAIIVMPSISIRISRLMNTWVETDHIFNAMDKNLKSERVFYRYHRIFGAFITLGSMFIFYTFVIQYGENSIHIRSIEIFSLAATDWLVTSLIFFVSLCSVVFMIFGLFIILRPSGIKQIEKKLNQWVDTGNINFNYQHQEADTYFQEHPRLIGLLVIAGGLYLLLSAGILLLN